MSFVSISTNDLKVLNDLKEQNGFNKTYNYEYNEQQNRKPTEVRY